jgi:hypothetical protein
MANNSEEGQGSQRAVVPVMMVMMMYMFYVVFMVLGRTVPGECILGCYAVWFLLDLTFLRNLEHPPSSG